MPSVIGIGLYHQQIGLTPSAVGWDYLTSSMLKVVQGFDISTLLVHEILWMPLLVVQ